MSPSVWNVLTELDIYRVTEVPRAPVVKDNAPTDRDNYRRQRMAALGSAYHSGAGPVVISWQRHSTAGPIHVHVGGAAVADNRQQKIAEEPVMLSLPAGARGHLAAPGTVATALARVPCWTPIVALTDGLVAEESRTLEQGQRPSLEDCLLGVWHGPFAWCVFAEPVSGAELDNLIAGVSSQQRQASAKAGSSPDYAVDEQRLKHRHRELSRATSTGLWRISFLAGGHHPRDATRVAALVCSSTDLIGLPYSFIPSELVGSLDAVLGKQVAHRGGSAPFYATTALLSAIAKPPILEVPGVRFRARPEFDVTPEVLESSRQSGTVRLGTVLDRNRLPAGSVRLPYSSLNRHAFVCGATGSGKSQTIRGLLEEAAAQSLPWLVVEPAKAEYRLMAARLAASGISVTVLRPGDVDSPPAGINPLEPGVDAEGRRYPLQTHLDLVRALFSAAFEADEPFPQVLAAALTRCYEQLGWDLVLGEPRNPEVQPRYPTLTDLQHAAEHVVNEIGYGKEIADNVRGFIRVRLSSLRLGTTGRFLEGGHPLDFDALLKSNVVLEIEDVGDDRDKAFLMGTVLIRLTEHLRLRQRRHAGPAFPLGHLTVFEEAHRLLRATGEKGPAAHAVEMFAGLLAEIRAYGEGLVIAEQIPSKLLPDVIKNTAVKIVHRLPAKDDRDEVGATMNITDAQSEYLVTLPPGQAAVFTDGMDFPILASMADGTERETGVVVAPATAAGLIDVRSLSCGAQCQSEPCTLRDIRVAQETLRTEPRLVLWAELAVLAHLTGWPTPIPRPELVEAFWAIPDRVLDCALSHAVDYAVASRSVAISSSISPGALAAHVVEALRELISGEEAHSCIDFDWISQPYRWSLVRDELALAYRKNPDARRHSKSEKWEKVYGCSIPGSTNREQLEVIQTRFVDDQKRGSGSLKIINYGVYPRSSISIALGSEVGSAEWNNQLFSHIGEYVDAGWVFDCLGDQAVQNDLGSGDL